MAATPQYAVMVFVSLRGKTYEKDCYISDVANALTRFDGGQGASAASPAELTFSEPVVLVDFAMHTGTADTTKIQITRNGMPTGDILRYAPHLDSLNNRPPLRVGIMTGVRFTANQLA